MQPGERDGGGSRGLLPGAARPGGRPRRGGEAAERLLRGARAARRWRSGAGDGRRARARPARAARCEARRHRLDRRGLRQRLSREGRALRLRRAHRERLPRSRHARAVPRAAAAVGGGVFVVLRSSNPGARDLQDLRVAERPLYERSPRRSPRRPPRCAAPRASGRASAWWSARPGPRRAAASASCCRAACSWCRATGRRAAARSDALAGFVPGPDGRLEGGLVSSSRAIGFPPEGRGADAAGWERAVDRALDAAIAELDGRQLGPVRRGRSFSVTNEK